MSTSLLVAGLVLLGSALLSFVLVAGVSRWAQRHLLDIPNERSSHLRPTPRGGGLAIVLVVLSGWSLVFPTHTALLGALLVAVVSWIDDVRSLGTKIRLLCHSVAAILAIASMGTIDPIPLPILGTLSTSALLLPLFFLWLVGLTNAYNFMDGIDGIAGGQAIVAGVGFMMLALLSGTSWMLIVGALVAGASTGFLFHNWPPARIFLGDVGSAFLGYLLAFLALAGGGRLFFAGMLLVWPFVFDAFFTFLRRLLRRENVFLAHRSHLYQRLIQAGLSHRQVTLIYLSLAVSGIPLALGFTLGGERGDLAVVGTLVLLASCLVIFVRALERRASERCSLLSTESGSAEV